jgi:hypothetical protein
MHAKLPQFFPEDAKLVRIFANSVLFTVLHLDGRPFVGLAAILIGGGFAHINDLLKSTRSASSLNDPDKT